MIQCLLMRLKLFTHEKKINQKRINSFVVSPSENGRSFSLSILHTHREHQCHTSLDNTKNPKEK